ncbi:hypothetical protein JCM10212_000564 [Sporobolomyces blumeae]
MPDPALSVKTEHGPIRGFACTHPIMSLSTAHLGTDGGLDPVHKWLGIPYAKARRFERPQDPDKWEDEKECTEYGTMFPQPPGMTETALGKLPGFIMRPHITQSEDSHTINVYAPGDVKEGEKLPVMVYVYGGALNTGSSDRFFYDPTSFVRSQAPSQRCIVVVGNYRVNIFGFGASEDLEEVDDEGKCGNYGLYDVIKIFEWVQTNISAFGGDPSRVTAFGQSAGAFLISYLLASGKKLFTRAILQSGAQKTMSIRPPAKAYPALPKILAEISNDASDTSSARSRADLLRSHPTVDLLALHKSHHSLESVSLTLESPSCPNAMWTNETVSRLERGEFDEWIESIVIGTTEDEGTLFAYGLGMVQEEAFEVWVRRFSPEVQDQIRTKYLLRREDGTTYHPEPGKCRMEDLPGSKLLADQIFVNPVWDFAKSAKDKARNRNVWMYRLRTGVEGIGKIAPFGVMHSGDLPFVFNLTSLWNDDPESAEGKTAKAMSSRWLDYACSGCPDPDWKAFEPSDPSWLVFTEAGKVSNESLADFEKNKIELVIKPKEEDERERVGDEVLGATNEE